jgi:DNA polymerase
MSGRRQLAFLHEMGIGPIWVRRAPGAGTSESGISALQDGEAVVTRGPVNDDAEIADRQRAPDVTPAIEDVASMDWEQLKATVAPCTRCGLCQTRTQAVFGVGDPQAKWLFVGEGPGRNEDAQGQPFVGPAGKLLDNMMVAMGLARGHDTYIANVVKCRPIDDNRRDRAPQPEEANACMPYLARQIALINPQVIVALGKTAALSLLQLDAATPVGKLRGIVHRYADRPLIVTYHPAYLLRTPADKGKVWADLCLAMQTYHAAGE